MKSLLNRIKKSYYNLSFSSRLSWDVILLTASLFIIASIVVIYSSNSFIEREALKNANNELNTATLEIENILTQVSVAINNMVPKVEEAAQDGDKDVVFGLTRQIVKNNEYIIGSNIGLRHYYFPETKYFSPYSFYESKDSIRTSQVGSDTYAYQTMDWYLIPQLLGKPYWTDPFFDEGAGNIIMCTYTHPLYENDGSFMGVLTADLSMEVLTEKVKLIKPYPSSRISMIGKGGSYIVHPDSNHILNDTIFSDAIMSGDTVKYNTGLKMVNGESGMFRYRRNGVPCFVLYRPITSTGWSIAIVCEYKDVFAGVITMTRIMYAVLFFGLLLLFSLVKRLVGKLSKPLAEFSNSANMIAKGNFNVPLPVIKTNDEFKALGSSMKYMQESLASYISELEQTTSAKERIESELSIARQIQMGMIPKIFPPYPERKDIDIFAMLHPAKEVGGDLYDFFINEEKLYFIIGDVSGKGVPASLLMAVARSLFRTVAATYSNPHEIVKSMNVAISESNERNMFITVFLGILDLKSGLLKYCNAGHNPPCLLDSSNVSFLEVSKNLPIGLFMESAYDTQEITLQPKQSLFMYTDGLTEAENIDKELYGEDNLLELLKVQGISDASSRMIVNDVYCSVEKHVNHAPQSDDLTVLTIKYFGQMDNGERRTLVIKNQIPELRNLTTFINSIGEEFNINPSLTISFNLAMEEAVSNVVLYAYPAGEINHTIEIIFEKIGKEITFTIYDTGVAFDPTAKPDADISLSAQEREIGGLGIYMVKQIMDSVEYKREDQMNILILKKKVE